MKNLKLPALKLIEQAQSIEKATAPLEGLRSTLRIDEMLIENISRGISIDPGLVKAAENVRSGLVLPEDLETVAGLSKAWAEQWHVSLAPILEMIECDQTTISALSANMARSLAFINESAVHGAAEMSKMLGDLPALSEIIAQSMREISLEWVEMLGPEWKGDNSALDALLKQAQALAEDPDAGPEEIAEFVGVATAVEAGAPEDKRLVLRSHIKFIVAWLFGTALQDPAKEAMRQALAAFLAVLSVVTTPTFSHPSVPTRFLPAPPITESILLASPGGWLSEGMPSVIRRAGPKAETRTLEFFTDEIRNPNTRRAYAQAVMVFFNWCEDRDLELVDITPFVLAAYIEQLQQSYSAPTVKQHLAALRMLFDYLVVGQVIPFNPASAVRGPYHSIKEGKTPTLSTKEARRLLDSIETDRLIGLRDRALIGLMVYGFARVNAALEMRVEDYYVQGRRSWVRLHEKGGKLHTLPCHHNLDGYLEAYITASGISDARKSPLFRTAADRSGRKLTENPLWQQDAYRMIQRRAKAAGIKTRIGNHTFRATGIAAYLKNGGRLEIAQQMANHESTRTTSLYDRRGDNISLNEVERIAI